MSIANLLEVRVPLLDKEVTTAAEKLYSGLGTTHNDLKKVLKEELYRYISKALVEKQKQGFTPPLLEWSRWELKPEIIDTLKRADEFGLNGVDNIINEYYQENKGSIEKLWTIYVLIKWLRISGNN